MKLGMGSTKRKVHHLLLKMRNNQRRNELPQISSNCICDLPLLLQSKKHGHNSNALHFLKTTYKKTNMPSPYEKLSKACLS
jgi:hypothetical protein